MPDEERRQCLEDCRRRYPGLRNREARQACQAECREGGLGTPPGDERPPTAGSPCEGDGYEGKQTQGEGGKWILLEPCRAGYKTVRAGTGAGDKVGGKIWCCKATEEKPDEIDPARPPNCEGGQRREGDTCPDNLPRSIFFKEERWCCPEKEEEEGEEDGTEGCPEGNYFASMDGTCPDGYVFIRRTGKGWEGYKEGAQGRCECSAWCLKSGYEADCRTKKGEGREAGGEWQWPEEIGGQYQALMDRLTELLNMPRGLSEAERQAITNYATTQIKGSERGRLESARKRMAQMGILGETYFSPEEEKIKRETRQLTSGVQQGIAIDETSRRFSELMQSTGMSAELLQFLSTFPTTQEAMNAARRGESSQALQMLMALLSGQGSNFNYAPWMQGLMTQYGGQQSGGSSMDWLAYLPFLLGGLGTGTRTYL